MIEISNIRAINKGDMLASCSVYLRPFKMKINKVVIFQKGVNRWVALPREKFETRDGETKYQPLIEWDNDGVDRRFRDQVIEAVDSYIQKHGDLVPEDVVRDDVDFPF